jgi:PAS domain S-box-containing protein
MAMPGPKTQERVLVLMPSAQDAARTCELLAEEGLSGVTCADVDAVCRELAAGAGVVLLTDEALGAGGEERLSAALGDQPAWSDVPVVVLTREGVGRRQVPLREAANVTLVERPVRMRTLLSVVHSGLRARRRQFETRDLLAERERSAEAMRAERERLRITLASIGDAVISTDAEGRVTFLNAVAEALTGWPEAEAAGRMLPDVFRIVNEHTREPVENPAVRALREGVIVGLANHTVLIARDGTERPIDDSAAPIRDGAGAPTGAVLVFRDVAERKRAEEARARLAAIVESSDDAIISKSLDGVIRSWNTGAERLFGYTPAEAVGRTVTLIVPPERLDEERLILDRLARGERVEHFETERLAKDGRRLAVSLSVSPLRDEGGRIVGASKVARDVTGRKRAEAALRAAEDRAEFVRRVSGLGFWYCDLPFDVLRWDERVKEHFWLPPDAHVTIDTFYARIHPEDREPTRLAVERSIAERAGYDVHYRTVDPETGATRWVRAIGRTFYAPDGTPRRFDGVTLDVTAQREAEQRLRVSEGRHRFLSDLAAATQRLSEPGDVMSVSARLLAEHLDVDRCAYAEVEDESVYVITGDHPRGVPSIVGRWPAAAFGAEHLRAMRADEPYVVTDSEDDPRVGPDDLPAYRATGIRAVICVPLHKGGKFTAAMAVHQKSPRRWTDAEIELVKTVVARCWEALERARVSRTLRESEARYRAIVETSPECVKLVAADGTLLQMNRAGLAMVEGDESVLGRCVYDVIAPEHRDAFIALNERVCRGERAVLEFDIIGLKGTRRHMETTAVPLPSPDGKFAQLAVTRDVTARRRVEEAIRERDERLQLFLGNATDYAVIISDVQDRVTEWLGGSEQIIGWRADEVMGKPLDFIFTPEDRAAGVPAAETARAAKTGRAENTRWHTRRAGSRFFAEGVTVSIRGPRGELRGFGKVFRDATDQKLAREALARDALLLANVRDSVVVTGPDGTVTYWNGGATRLFGWTAEEMVGRHYADRFPEPTRTFVADQIRERAAGVEWAGEYEDYRKDGSRVWIDARVGPVTDGEGRVVGVLGVSHDITDRKRAEEALRDADRKKDEFIALLAHELRNPLAPIRNGLHVMRLAAGDADAVGEARAMMERQLGHMVRLIDDLLDVSRISRNKMELRRSRVALAEVVGSAIETARPLIDAGGHTLSVALPDQPVFLDADLTRMAQVLGNLLTNSAKYTEPGGHIRLTAERRGGDALISVRDDGIGIPAESLRSIFDMFSQVDRSIERSTGGLGIGLALVKGLVEMHGGAVTAESEGPGRGSTFTVRLPALEDRAERVAESTDQEGPSTNGRKRRVLVVDDNRDSATSLAKLLRLLGDEVRIAHDGVEAVEAAELFRPHVILMDVGMPKLNGYEATQRIRERPWGRSVAIVALTGWGQQGDRERSRAAGCDGHLVKPLSLPDLQKLLEELTGDGDHSRRHP